ncbi:uncharacterized protein LOC105433704 [Pogonomyrmex barbatus]|uniref:Uncharacterized protein LOC105433704 n=1 Tax=Pogonomyrmex barbatus TaxID=144034 RepID=A0A6I9WVN1_9HYME|nr:uncharacterized protein LOC105433704 [Pogonomyrmex barbatus]
MIGGPAWLDILLFDYISPTRCVVFSNELISHVHPTRSQVADCRRFIRSTSGASPSTPPSAETRGGGWAYLAAVQYRDRETGGISEEDKRGWYSRVAENEFCTVVCRAEKRRGRASRNAARAASSVCARARSVSPRLFSLKGSLTSLPKSQTES